jgi:DNA mismatch repair protein MutS
MPLSTKSNERLEFVGDGVTELITPGVSYNDKILDNKSNNYLAAVCYENDNCGIAFLDISTGEFMATQGPVSYIDKLIQGFKPSETLVSKKDLKNFKSQFG